jgi:hypothetical protein
LYLIPQRAEAGTFGQCWAAHRPRYRSTFSGGAEFIIDFSDTAEDYFSAWSGSFSLYNPGFQGQYASLALAVTF